MEPPRDRKGKKALDDARMPGDVEIAGPFHTTLVVPGPVYGPWDVYADDDLRELSTRGLLGGRRDPDADTAPSAPLAHGVESGQVVRSDHAATGSSEPSRGAKRLTKVEIRIRRTTQAALALRAEGWEIRDIAAHFGVTSHTITGWFASHRRVVTQQDLDTQLDQIAVPLATENLIHGLLAGDKDYTLETLKGRGVLRRHGESDKAPSTALPELVIRFEAPAQQSQSNDSLIAGGRIVGVISQPKRIEGTVVESRPLETVADVGTGTVQVPRAAAPDAAADR